MTGQMGFWSITERLAEISALGDPLETLAATVDFEMFRPIKAGLDSGLAIPADQVFAELRARYATKS